MKSFKLGGKIAGKGFQLGSLLNPLLSRNSDIVEASGYPAINTTAENLSFVNPRYFLNKNNVMRVRQTGLITKVKFYATASTTTNLYVQAWRKNGTVYDRIAQSENIGASLVGGVNEITLSTQLDVQEGDFISFGGTSNIGITATAGYAVGSLRYTTAETPAASGFDWDAKPALAFVLPIKTYQQAPLIVGVGNSIGAGHPAHYSYIENSLTSSPLNCILAQMKLIDTKYLYQNMGIGGHTSTDVKNRFMADVVAMKPKLTLINGGVNDIELGVITKEVFLANYTFMLNACVAASIVPVVCKIAPWTNGTTAQMRIRDEWNADLAALVATYTGAICIDLDSTLGEYDATGDPGNLWNIKAAFNADNVHFNLDGYAAFAAKIDTEIKKKYRL